MYFYWEQKSSRLNDTNEISPGIIVKKEHSTVNASSNSGTRQRTNVRTENNVQIKISTIDFHFCFRSRGIVTFSAVNSGH